jgi:hypothetical protein
MAQLGAMEPFRCVGSARTAHLWVGTMVWSRKLVASNAKVSVHNDDKTNRALSIQVEFPSYPPIYIVLSTLLPRLNHRRTSKVCTQLPTTPESGVQK